MLRLVFLCAALLLGCGPPTAESCARTGFATARYGRDGVGVEAFTLCTPPIAAVKRSTSAQQEMITIRIATAPLDSYRDGIDLVLLWSLGKERPRTFTQQDTGAQTDYATGELHHAGIQTEDLPAISVTDLVVNEATRTLDGRFELTARHVQPGGDVRTYAASGALKGAPYTVP
jgi:hypothetical protein